MMEQPDKTNRLVAEKIGPPIDIHTTPPPSAWKGGAFAVTDGSKTGIELEIGVTNGPKLKLRTLLSK